MKSLLNNTKTVGVGVDIEDISRFKKKPFEENNDFYEKIFTEKEIKYCTKKLKPYQHFVVRFCAKEAFIKAIDQKIKNYKSIEIKMKENNQPFIEWAGVNVFLSISHDKDKAVAFVVVEK